MFIAPRYCLASLALFCSLNVFAIEGTDCAVLSLDQEDAAALPAQQQLAEDGDACAQFNLGFYYYTQQDYERAEQQYAQAAEQGNARAAFEIAIFYRDNLVMGGYQPRRLWMERAAEMGLGLAQIELGLDHLEERENPAELLNAMEWFEKAAQQGNSHAQYLLSELYWHDARGLQDMAMPAEGEPDAAIQREMHFSSDNGKAVSWLCKAAQNENGTAQYALSEVYSNGRGDVPPSQIQRRLWLEKAAANDNEDAISALDTSSEAWYTTAEKWLKWQMVSEEARCPEVALAVEQ